VGSAEVAVQIQQVLQAMGLQPVQVLSVTISESGSLEAAARSSRYAALDTAANACGAAAVLLGHTRDDQAETVLLGLARGSGARTLSGMPTRRGIYRRPLLTLDRETTGAACAAAGLDPWDDPHNDDRRFSRARVRRDVLPVLETELGPGIAAALARTADLLRDDDEALEEWAGLVAMQTAEPDEGDGWDCSVLGHVPAAVRRRVIRTGALAAGVPGGSLRQSQLAAVDALIVAWHGQGPVDLPGGVGVERRCGRLRFVSGRPTSSHEAPKE
jgi:tRNA(Ile)-lysidine synthase